jgi:hypothetical protein
MTAILEALLDGCPTRRLRSPAARFALAASRAVEHATQFVVERSVRGDDLGSAAPHRASVAAQGALALVE